MVKEQLTDAMIDAGAELIRELDENGVPVTTALWLFDPEVNEWRLHLASPEVGTKGPIQMYTKVQHAMSRLGDTVSAVPFFAIRVFDANDELARQLRTAIRTGPALSRIRFKRQVADDHFIEDALIYRAA